MKKALVTGASSGIGLSICKMLRKESYTVYGIARTTYGFSQFEGDAGFHGIMLDITDTQSLMETVKEINKEHDIALLVNNAGVGYYGLHEELKPAQISEMVRTNLEAPMILCNLLLRDLKKNQGTIIQITSVTAEECNPHGCAYGATKAGLSSFTQSLFAEARKYGVRTMEIRPDMTQTNLYRHADFEAAEEEEASLTPEDVADAVQFALSARDGSVVTSLTVRPQLHRIKKKK